MAFSLADFQQVGPGSAAPRLWTYTTTDSIADVNTAGYFNDQSDSLTVGDLIYCNTSTGGTLVCTLTQVLTNAAGVVDVADGTTLAATDGD
jgi:hypothetical protein